MGGSITLTNPPCGFPTGLAAKNGNQCAELSWNPVPGASSYNLRYSLLNGGPYSVAVVNTTNVDYVIGGLANGQTYYFAVTAIIGGVEGIPSGQVPVNPFDTTQFVLATGSVSEGGQYTPGVGVNPAGPASGQPSYIGAYQYTGAINPRELDYYGYGNLQNETIGTKGYVIYDYSGDWSVLTNFTEPITFTLGSGWNNIYYLERQYNISNNVGATEGLDASPIASINIGVSDTNFHYLTVVSPAQFNNGRLFNMRLTSANNASASFAINENPGYSHIFQYLFRGNATLWADGTGGSNAIVQSLFLDDAPVTFSPVSSTGRPPAPTGLHVIP